MRRVVQFIEHVLASDEIIIRTNSENSELMSYVFCRMSIVSVEDMRCSVDDVRSHDTYKDTWSEFFVSIGMDVCHRS